jgi:glycosyltransferase involved in cell wall biosynthesis
MSDRPKIALCLEHPLAFAGGVSVLAQVLIGGLAGRYRITLVSTDTPESFCSLPLRDAIERHVPWDANVGVAENGRTLARALAESGIRVAHFHFSGNFGWQSRFPWRCPIPTLARLGVPIVTTVHMVVGLLHGYCGPQKPLWFKLGFLPWAWQAKVNVLRHVRREIAVSQQDYTRLRRWYWPVRNRFVQIYHSRIIASGGGAIAGPGRQRVVLSAGHIAARKGQDILAQAFARISSRHPDWKLVVAGPIVEENCRRNIERAAAQCAKTDQIEILGQREDVSEIMQRAAVYVQPSLHEGLPLALQEAMYHQCACLATRIPGNIELVDDQTNGLLVSPGNWEAMSVSLDRLLSDQNLRERLAANSRTDILKKEMTAAHMIEKHLMIYESVVRRG